MCGKRTLDQLYVCLGTFHDLTRSHSEYRDSPDSQQVPPATVLFKLSWPAVIIPPVGFDPEHAFNEEIQPPHAFHEDLGLNDQPSFPERVTRGRFQDGL